MLSLNLSISFETSSSKHRDSTVPPEKVHWGCYSSQFGSAIIVTDSTHIRGIGFSKHFGEEKVRNYFKNRLHNTFFEENRERIHELGKKIFLNYGPLKIKLSGTTFQIKVWKALSQTKPAQTLTYSDITKMVGYKGATRAVANAIGKNPIAWLIPCHRIIEKSGKIGGYCWGIDIKRSILSYESFTHKCEG